MNVLDIDLDFFLHQRVADSVRHGRPSSEDIDAWTPNAVERFLERQCGLDARMPVAGCVVTEHHELFDIWKRLIENRELTTPFNLVHVDAHADMGMGFGDTSAKYIMGELLHKDVSQRTSPKCGNRDGLRPGNYLVFAMACRWVGSFTYVHHPHVPRENIGIHDIPNIYFKECDPHGDRLQLKALPPESLRGLAWPQRSDVLHFEPEIPFTFVSGDEFTWERAFSFMFVAKSPQYTPPSADKLLSTLERFMIDQADIGQIHEP